MRHFSLIVAGFVLLHLVGCGEPATTTPSGDELSQYVAENPSDLSSGADLDSGDTAD